MSGVAWDEINEGRDIFPPIVFIDRISVMDRIEKEFLNPEFREVCFHGEKRVEKRKYTMPGSSFQKREHWNVVKTGSHIHVKVITEEIAFRWESKPHLQSS